MNNALHTPLHVAAEFGHDDVVGWLLAHDADPTIKDKNGRTAYDLAMASNHINSAFIISNFTDNLEQEKQSYNQGKMGRLEIALLVPDYRRLGLLHYLAQVGDVEKLKSEISASDNINLTTLSGKTPLHFAVINRQYDALSLLLESGSDPNIGDMSNKTPIYYAVEMEDMKAIQTLLDYGADPIISTSCKDKTSLDFAKRIGNQEVISILEQK